MAGIIKLPPPEFGNGTDAGGGVNQKGVTARSRSSTGWEV